MNKISHIVCCGLLLVFNSLVSAQSSEFSIAAGVGQGGLKYAVAEGTNKLKMGYQAGIGYTYFVNDRWGIGGGMELGYYQTHAELSGSNLFTSNMVDSEGEGFEYRQQIKGYREKQKLYALNIPLYVQYLVPSRKNIQWYAKGGIKIAIPLSASYKAHADEVQLSGYYPNVHLEVTDLPAHGFGKYSNFNGEGNYRLNPSALLMAETGAKLRLSNSRSMYAGVFIDYGLNNVKQREEASSLIGYHYATMKENKANGIFSLPNTVGNVRLINYGVRISYTFSGGR